MEKRYLEIEGIPAVLWGPAEGRLFLAVHGDQSNKEDEVPTLFAEEAAQKGWRTLSFDLPEHGDRKGEPRLCNAQNCIEDLAQVMEYAHTLTDEIGFFGCSIGAYFGMLAYRDEPLRQALFLSPVVDMKRIIENMMKWFDVSTERLRQEKEIATPVKTLYWDYYEYVFEHPIEWKAPTALLYGRGDNLCEFDVVSTFVGRTHAEMTVFEEGEHYFHTEKQLAFFRRWLREHIPD